ncbi:MAG: hypothetical protein LBP54_05790 [Campylobacteraceae bacterium]|nr:hypothetical protein [Campylobacteraceae bacterium]
MNNDILYETDDRNAIWLIVSTASLSLFLLLIFVISIYSQNIVIVVICIIISIPVIKICFDKINIKKIYMYKDKIIICRRFDDDFVIFFHDIEKNECVISGVYVLVANLIITFHSHNRLFSKKVSDILCYCKVWIASSCRVLAMTEIKKRGSKDMRYIQ